MSGSGKLIVVFLAVCDWCGAWCSVHLGWLRVGAFGCAGADLSYLKLVLGILYDLPLNQWAWLRVYLSLCIIHDSCVNNFCWICVCILSVVPVQIFDISNQSWLFV